MKVSIIGSGVVGKATGLGLRKHGHDVIFYDVDNKINKKIANEGQNVASEINDAIVESEVHMICVPTPLKGNALDVSFLRTASEQIAQSLIQKKQYQIVVIRSTIFPGTTKQQVVPIFKAHSALTLGRDYGICYNPEFIRAAYSLEDFLDPPIIVIGDSDENSGKALSSIYSSFQAPKFRTTIENAEAIKCFSNVYNAMKVSFFNQIYLLAGKCGLDHQAISEAMTKASLGIRLPGYYTKGGYPFGGACLPKDLAASISFFKEHGLNSHLFEAVYEINEELKRVVSTGTGEEERR